MKKKILIVLACLVAVAGVLCGIYLPDSEINNTIDNIQGVIIDEIENLSTTEIPQLSETDEQTLEVQETEDEAFELQGEIAYEAGENSNDYNVNLGEYAGLTYYSQIDSRWKKHSYTSTNNPTQTIGSSGCGPTSAAMVVSSIKGTITPDTMGNLFVANGYRSANNGTYWSAFRYVADKFNIGYQESSNINKALQLLESKNYVIASVGNGLFTTGGHFIVLVGVEGDTIKVYDPYLYSGKFETSTRRGKVTVDGNIVYVSIDNFKTYANYKRFFCFKNDREDIKENNTTTTITNTVTSDVTNVNYQVKVTASGLNIRSGASVNYDKIGLYTKNNIVTVLAESNGWGKTEKGWINLSYTSKYVEVINNIVGQTKKLAKASILYKNSNLSGTKYNYKANTTITILQNITSNIDKVRVKATGRIAYIDNSNYTNITISGYKATTGQYKRLATKTTLYANSNLTGTRYTYLAMTQVKIIKNISSTVDYVYCVKTKRYAYVKTSAYK